MRENYCTLWKLYIWQLQCSSNSAFRPTHKPSFLPLKSSTVLGQCDTCHWHLKTVECIYWRVVSSRLHSWLLTAALLWCWRLKRPTLCWICAAVDVCDLADRRNMSVVPLAAEDYRSTVITPPAKTPTAEATLPTPAPNPPVSLLTSEITKCAL